MLATLIIGHALIPARTIIDGLRKLRLGDLSWRLPRFRAAEFNLIARAFNELSENLARTNAARAELTTRLFHVQEEERRALARDLHDEFGQCLSATAALAASIEAGAPPDRGRWLAPPLVAKLKDRLAKGEQSLLFLNRRGYAPLTLCRHCGFRFQCPNCSAWLVEHRLSRRLACHHCGHETATPSNCPECGEPDCLVACGPGVERIADEVAEIMPEARVAIATSDTLNSPEKIANFIGSVEEGAVDVIVGTQLVTKGFHFPELTLVGVVDADLGLEGGDLRAAERTYQQIAQVAGRAGRGAKPGEVLIQTRHPEATVIAALTAGDRDAFYDAETEARRHAGAPPFGRWAAIIVSSEDESEAREAARRIGATRPELKDVMILGPAAAPLSLLRGRYRHRLLINARRSAQVQDVIRDWLGALSFPQGVRVSVDIDPYSFV